MYVVIIIVLCVRAMYLPVSTGKNWCFLCAMRECVYVSVYVSYFRCLTTQISNLRHRNVDRADTVIIFLCYIKTLLKYWRRREWRNGKHDGFLLSYVGLCCWTDIQPDSFRYTQVYHVARYIKCVQNSWWP